MMAWTFEFIKFGGYDCMTDSFDIFCDGAFRFMIDQYNFGQKRNEDRGIEIPEAKALAIKVVDALNKN